MGPLEVDRKISRMAYSAPVQVQIDVTDECNQNCRHCYWGHELQQCAKHLLSLDEISSLLESLVNSGVFFVSISGGEPFSRSDIMELLQVVAEYTEHFNLSIFTNGTLIDSEGVRRMREIFGTHTPKVEVQFSLDSTDPQEYAYLRGTDQDALDRVLDAIRAVGAHGFAPTTLTTATNENVEKCLDIAKFALLELGVRGAGILPVFVGGKSNRSVDSMQVKYKDWEKLVIEATKIRRFSTWGPLSNRLNVRFFSYYEVFLPLQTAGMIDAISDIWNVSCHPSSVHEASRSGLCSAGLSAVHIASDGSVYPCTWMVGDKELSAGSIRNTELSDIWRDSEILEWFRLYDASDSIQGGCAGCALLTECGGGCRAYAIMKLHNKNASDTRCPLASEPAGDHVGLRA